MFKALTPDSDPTEIAAFAEMLPKLAQLLNTDAEAKRLLEEARQGHLSEQDLVLHLAARLQIMDEANKR